MSNTWIDGWTLPIILLHVLGGIVRTWFPLLLIKSRSYRSPLNRFASSWMLTLTRVDAFARMDADPNI